MHAINCEYVKQYDSNITFNMGKQEFGQRVHSALVNIWKLRNFRGDEEEQEEILPELKSYLEECEVDSPAALIGKVNCCRGDSFSARFIQFEVSRQLHSEDFVLSFECQDQIAEALDQDVALHHNHYVDRQEKSIIGWSHKNCNSKVRLNLSKGKIKTSIYAHNLGGIDMSALVGGINLTDWDTSRIDLRGESANTLKSMTIGDCNYFRDTYGWFQASLDKLSDTMDAKEVEKVKKMMERYLSQYQPFGDRYESLILSDKDKVLQLCVKKGAIPYEYFRSIEIMNDVVFPSPECFSSVLKCKKSVSQETYDNTKFLFDKLCTTLGDLLELYQALDVVILGAITQNRFSKMSSEYGLSPHRFTSMAMYTKSVAFRINSLQDGMKPVVGGLKDVKTAEFFRRASFGGYSSTPVRLGVNTAHLLTSPELEQEPTNYLISTKQDPESVQKVLGKMCMTTESFDEHGKLILMILATWVLNALLCTSIFVFVCFCFYFEFTSRSILLP